MDLLYRKKLEPPYKPKVEMQGLDLSNFDKEIVQ